MSGAIPSLLLYAFMTWAGRTLLLSEGTKQSKVSLSSTSVDNRTREANGISDA